MFSSVGIQTCRSQKTQKKEEMILMRDLHMLYVHSTVSQLFARFYFQYFALPDLLVQQNFLQTFTLFITLYIAQY